MIKKSILLCICIVLAQPAVADDPPATDSAEFVFARLIYSSGLASFWRRENSWATDYPEADYKFMYGIERLSNVRVQIDENPVAIMDPELFRYPFIYAVEVGYMDLRTEEAERLREYLLRGGFWVIDDFWGSGEWRNFYAQLKKIFPDREVEEIPLSHPIFHSFFDIDEILQVPNVGNGCSGRGTFEQDGYVPHVLGVFDGQRRPMMVINWNTDLGDAWEWADEPCYPHEFSGFAYRMGLNFIIYSMTH
jgi:hypothetical protein